MKVLIVKVSALGDVIHALPALAWIRSADPSVEIDWLVEESFASLLEGHPLLENVIRLRTKAWRREGALSALRGALGLIGCLRRNKYDLVLDLQGNSKSGLFTLFSGAPLRYGFDRGGVREWPNLLSTNRRVALGPEDHHISDRSLALARAAFPAGSERPLAGPMAIDPEAAAAVEARLETEGFGADKLVVLHYGTTWRTKLWPLDCWQQLAAGLRAAGLRPVLTWGNEEEHAAALAIAEASGALVWPRGSLPELAALLKRADLVVGGDTGPVHIAAALETATVSLFRVTDAERNGPRGKRHIRLQSPLDCSPCLKKACSRDRECGHSIEVPQVLKAVCDLL